MTRTRLGYGNAEGLSRKNKQTKIVTLSVQMNVEGAELSMGWQIGAAERTSHIECVANMPIRIPDVRFSSTSMALAKKGVPTSN